MTLRAANVSNGVSYSEWQHLLCVGPSSSSTTLSSSSATTTTTTAITTTTTTNQEIFTSSKVIYSSSSISQRPLLVGGPGTTATRSFALALNLLGQSVLHYGVYRNRQGILGGWSWNQVVHELGIKDMVETLYSLEKWQTLRLNYSHLYDDNNDDDHDNHNNQEEGGSKRSIQVDAVLDTPFVLFVTDLLRYFPNLKILMTHRDPTIWYSKRIAFCDKLNQNRRLPMPRGQCDFPFLLRPIQKSLRDMTVQQSNAAFWATEQVLQCLVGAKNYQQVSAWEDPPSSPSSRPNFSYNNSSSNNITSGGGGSGSGDTTTGGWFPLLADFVGAPLPPSNAQCTLPQRATHLLQCLEEDTACRHCRHYQKRQQQQQRRQKQQQQQVFNRKKNQE
jgi:hypothetical protein